MSNSTKLIIAAQFYPPDTSTTAVYVGKIADALAADQQVVVISATPDSGGANASGRPAVVEVSAWKPLNSALVQRAVAICLLATRMFFSVLRRAGPGDLVFCVTAPFTLPYAVLTAAKLKGAATVLLVYDLYPEALEAAGVTTSSSVANRLIRWANSLLFKRLDAIIVIGRDVPPLIQAYQGVEAGNLHYIPNWALVPIGYRPIDAGCRFRAPAPSRFMVGLSGNLGFTHDPATVYEAAKLLRNDQEIHFILSGWGVGWKGLNEMFARDPLPNVTLLEPVAENELVDFLSAADLWVIPYHRNVAGVSVPSRLYNILAVGRPVIVASEASSEGALVLTQEAIGWVVPPENPAQLAHVIREAARDRQATIEMGRHAASVARKYSEDVALARYRRVVDDVMRPQRA